MNKIGLSQAQILAIEPNEELRLALIRNLDNLIPDSMVFCCRSVPDAVTHIRVFDWYDVVVLGTEPNDTPVTIGGKLDELAESCQDTIFVLFMDHDVGVSDSRVHTVARKPHIKALADVVRPLVA